MESIPHYPIPGALYRALNHVNWKKFRKTIELPENSIVYLEVLKQLNDLDKLNIYSKDYIKTSKLALYIEKNHSEREIKKFLSNSKIKKINNPSGNSSKNFYLISLSKNIDKDWKLSKIEINNGKTKQVLKVETTAENEIVASADKEEIEEEKFFRKSLITKLIINSYPFDCCHFSLGNLTNSIIKTRLNPCKIQLTQTKIEISNDSFINKSIADNLEQKLAITNIINKTSQPAPFLLYGPPGTGKTTTLVESIIQLLTLELCDINKKILICTPSNTAADIITLKLIENKVNTLVRLYAKSRDPALIDKRIKPYAGTLKKNQRVWELTENKTIIICTLCFCTRLTLYHMQEISYVFIDEAGQATESETIIPFTLNDTCHIILSGDPLQLGPVVKSELAKTIMGTSLLER